MKNFRCDQEKRIEKIQSVIMYENALQLIYQWTKENEISAKEMGELFSIANKIYN